MFTKKTRNITILAIGIVFAVSVCIGLSGSIAMADCPDDDEFTTDFRMEKCNFRASGKNPYFILRPGYQLVLEGWEDDEFIRTVITVLDDTKIIDLADEGIGMVKTRVVEEREWVGEDEEDLEIEEVSRNYFARCKQTNAIYYFGEWVINYEDGEPVDNEGSWVAGENNALPGLIMPGTFLLGSKYFQEIAEEDDAVDRGENTAMDIDIIVGAGEFEDCVEVVDTNPAEGVCDVEEGDVKIYCPDVGLVMDEDLQLVEYGYDIFDLDEDEDEEE